MNGQVIRNCSSCRHCKKTGTEGHCRRFPPSVVVLPRVQQFQNKVQAIPVAVYPAVGLADEGCGEYRQGDIG